jgi:thiopurine S-methyltransferase
MDPDFWQQRWATGRTAFHAPDVNELLKAHFDQLALPRGSRIFVPLCGKTHDLDWLVEHGYGVVGIELNRFAVDAVFERMGLVPQTSRDGGLVQLKAWSLEIFVGNLFDLTLRKLGPVGAVYDRAALVAFPDTMRQKYADCLKALTAQAPQLLITYEYDQSTMDGPPFSVPGEEIDHLYGDRFRRQLLSSRPISGLLAERCTGTEVAWLLAPKSGQR